VIVSIAEDGESAAPAAATTAAKAHAGSSSHGAGGGSVGVAAAPASAAAAGAPAARVQATPAVRQLAKQLGVAIESLAGSGPGGAVTADDVKRASSSGDTTGGATAPATTRTPKSDEPEERQALRGLRRRIAEHMRHSLSTAAAFTFVAECDFTEVLAHRERTSAKADAAGVKLTPLAYVFRALIEPLRAFPLLNASLDDAAHEIVLKHYYHLGLATATDDGLTVPILHHADRMKLFALAREIERLATAARTHKLKVEELQGGTFTVTSTGARGGVLATPILHHPQVAILGVHEIKQKPAVVDDAIVIRSLGNLSLSLDHRVVDGAVGADFLYTLIERLQTPQSWLVPEDLS
jgi:pyruvate dehydrogenase E2 component (dihydrolipoamide acetyltransferase)